MLGKSKELFSQVVVKDGVIYYGTIRKKTP